MSSVDGIFSLGDTGLPYAPVPQLLLVQQAYLAYAPSEWGFSPPPAFRAKMGLLTSYFRLGLDTVEHFTVQSNSMKAHLCERWKLSPARVTVVPSAVSLSSEHTWPESIDGPPYLLYVASASPHKNFEILGDVLAEVGREYRDLRLKLTVRRDDVPALVDRARDLGCLERIDFLGPVSNVDELISRAVLCVIPSKLESFGLSYFETMSIGCPLVVSDRDFAREACADAALYANPDRPAEFSVCVRRLLDDTEARSRHSRRGLRRYEEVAFSWNEIAESYRMLLGSITRSRSRSTD
jgi:glycosyltransferase involved in cell wall biosynthesis